MTWAESKTQFLKATCCPGGFACRCQWPPGSGCAGSGLKPGSADPQWCPEGSGDDSSACAHHQTCVTDGRPAGSAGVLWELSKECVKKLIYWITHWFFLLQNPVCHRSWVEQNSSDHKCYNHKSDLLWSQTSHYIWCLKRISHILDPFKAWFSS